MTNSEPPVGTNTLLLGEVGNGKTSSLPTFIAAGVKLKIPLKLAVIITDPGGEESLLDGMRLHAPPGLSLIHISEPTRPY